MTNEQMTMTETTENAAVVLAPRPRVTLNPKYFDPTKTNGNLYYSFRDADGTMHQYATPGAYTMPINDEAKAKALVGNLVPQLYLQEPLMDYHVGINVSAGWFYSDSGAPSLSELHGAIDYSRDFGTLDGKLDPSFDVCSVGSGKVVGRFWDNLTGNTIVIEHLIAGGMKYRSIYCHLRNGATADYIAAINVPFDPNKDDTARRYHRYASLSTRPSLWWGTETQKMKVHAGDIVSNGQPIAYAGNTGTGGAGSGLNMDGTPTYPTWANIHLHLFFAIPRTATTWMLIDPYGGYNDARYGMYQPGHTGMAQRFFKNT